jgi:serine/threonine protein kinase
MAPEVLLGQVYTESADVFSVAVVAWELFTG